VELRRLRTDLIAQDYEIVEKRSQGRATRQARAPAAAGVETVGGGLRGTGGRAEREQAGRSSGAKRGSGDWEAGKGRGGKGMAGGKGVGRRGAGRPELDGVTLKVCGIC